MPALPSLDRPPPRYQCVRCGNCCRWPGDVNVTSAETAAIAEHLGLCHDRFVQDFTRLNSKRSGLSLIDKPNGECVFLEGANVCRIQPVKPGQCSGFPNEWQFSGWRDQCEAIDLEAARL